MDLKKFVKNHKGFVFVGIPCFIFVFYIIINYYVLFTSFYALILIILMAAYARKKDASMRFTKIGVLMVIIFFLNFYNLSHFPNQIARHSLGGRQALLDPEHEQIAEIKQHLFDWHHDVYNVSFNSLNESSHEELELKMDRVHYFIYNKVMEYTSDSAEPYYTGDHIASLDEIFASDTDNNGRYQDDCDGISVVTASLLLNMGYNAFIAECLGHWHTIVFPSDANPKAEEGYEQGIHLYNWWGRPTYYVFNESEVIIPPGRPLALSYWELFMEGRSYENEYVPFFYGSYIDLPLFFLVPIGYGLLFLAALAIYYVIKFGNPAAESIRQKKIRWFFSKKAIKITFKMSLMGAFAAFILFWFAMSGLAFLGNVIMGITLISVIRYADYAIVKKSERI